MSRNPVVVSSARGARAKQLQQELDDLTDTIQTLRNHPEASKADWNPTVLRALEREHADLKAEWQREIATMTGDSAFGSVLAKGQSMRDAVGNGGTEVTLGQIIKGRGLGRWEGVPADAKALILSDGASGAIPGSITSGIVDLARQGSVVFRGGANLMPIASPSARVARMTSAPTVQWEPESAERSLDDQAFVFDTAELTAQTAWLYATISIEASEDVLDLDQAIMNHFAQQLALTFDEAGLAGTGVDQPVGLCNMGTSEDRILEQNAVGPILKDLNSGRSAYLPFVQAVGAVKAKHYEPSSAVITPGLWSELNALTDDDGNPLVAPRAYTQLQEYVSDFLPADDGEGGDEHTAIIGDLSAMTFGVKTGSQLEISRLGEGFAKGSIALRGYIRFGWYLTRPEAICVMRGITLPVVEEESP